MSWKERWKKREKERKREREREKKEKQVVYIKNIEKGNEKVYNGTAMEQICLGM